MAPIPGKGVVGVEVPNQIAQMVTLREMLDGEAWRGSRAAVPLALGKDVGGNDIVADLARMPHLLIAGATGSGKTVCMNAILAGLLMSRSPADLRLILVDPKIVEFAPYGNLPHLVVPVITDPKKVALGLRWAINEMERRYKMFAKAGVRNIESFNSRAVVSQGDLFGAPPENAESIPPRVPYIVIVIDELADLMLADQAEIENCIARLAQLSRAVGIHMIIATQRPSVNVITGTIKANFPARLAFQVAQKVDSRTILDTAGADKLLGRGDMLFLPPGSSKLIRAQGAMVSDPDIKRLVDYIRAQAGPEYEVEIKEKLEKADTRSGASDDGDGVDDALLEQCIQVIRETRRASTSSLQRRLRIGYTRAARIMDILEERGVVGPPRGSDPREILIDLDGEIPDNAPTEGGPQ
jgi:S-DNA-T family DNA segregation ATPase FtsK/SpoIIIE